MPPTRLIAYAMTLAGSVPAWHDSIEIAAGRGEKGPWRQNASRYDYVDDGTVAFAPGGGLYLAWADQASHDVWLRTMSHTGRLGPPVNAARSPATFSWAPRIAVDPARPRRVYLLWQEIIFSGGSHGGEILFARSDDGGAHFSAPLNLSRSPGGDGKGRLDRATWSNGSLDLAVAADGNLLAAWTEYQGALWLARSRDGGATFTTARRIAGDDLQPARAPALAAGPGGAVVLAWTVGEDPHAAIRLARSDDHGVSFAAPRLIPGGPGASDAPKLAIDRAGRVHLVFAQRAPGGASSAVRHAVAPPDSGFGPARTVSTGLAGGAAYPALGRDGGDALVVAWEQLGADGRSQALGMAVSRDGGRSFGAPAVVPGSAAPAGGVNGSRQGLLGSKLAVDPAGQIALVNSSLVPGVHSRVWLLRGSVR
jgi:hypothetical protein